MIDFNSLNAHTSKLIYISGVPHINVHVHYVDEKTVTYYAMDIKYIDHSPVIESCLGFEPDEQLQILALVDQKRELFFSIAKEQGIIRVNSEEELLAY